MSFKTIETYFSARLKEIDPKFKEHEDSLSSENIGASNYDRAFFIFYNDLSGSSLSQQTTTDVLSVDVSLFLKGFRDPKDVLIRAWDIANSFRLNAMKPEFAMTGALIKGVVCRNIKPEILKSNETAIKITCTFDVTVTFGTSD